MKPPAGPAQRQEGAYLCATTTVHIGAHGVVGTGPAHIQMCAVPGLDEPDEVPTLPLRPDRKLCGRPAPARFYPSPGGRCLTLGWGALIALTLPSLPDSMHSSMRCGEAAQWICQRWRLEDAACWPAPDPGLHALRPACPSSRPALTMRGSRLMSCRSRDST